MDGNRPHFPQNTWGGLLLVGSEKVQKGHGRALSIGYMLSVVRGCWRSDIARLRYINEKIRCFYSLGFLGFSTRLTDMSEIC